MIRSLQEFGRWLTDVYVLCEIDCFKHNQLMTNSCITHKINHKWSLQGSVLKWNVIYYSRMKNKGKNYANYLFFCVIHEPTAITKKQLSRSIANYKAPWLMLKKDMFKLYLWTDNRIRPLLCPFWLSRALFSDVKIGLIKKSRWT